MNEMELHMKFTPLTSSLLALALFSLPVSALSAQAAATDSFVIAQADEGAGNLDAIKKFLAGGKNLSKLDEDRLQQRLKRAQRFLKVDGLPPDLASGLEQEVAQINSELASRQSAGGTETNDAPAKQEASEQNTAEQSAPPAESAEQPAKKKAATATGGGSTEISAFLQSVKPAADLNDKELRQQMRQAVQLAKSEGLSGEEQQQLRQVARDSRAEMERREGSGETAQTEAPADPSAAADATAKKKTQAQVPAQPETQAGTTAAQGTGEVDVFLQSVRAAADLGDAELRQQTRRAAELAKSANLSKDDRQKLRQVMRDGRVEMARRKDGGSQQQTATKQDNVGKQDNAGNAQTAQPNTQQAQLDNTKVDAGSEQKARALLDAQVDVRKLSRRELRQRLSTMRDLLASNQLAPATKREMRQRLAEERVVLRSQVDQDGSSQQGSTNTQGGNVSGSNNSQTNTSVTVNNNITNNDVKVILRDRRPPRDLKAPELRRRINVYRDIVVDSRYPENERQQLRVFLERDRVVLRERMLNERRRRQQELQTGDIDIDLNLDFQSDREPLPRSVFAAEADEEELEEILAAPPRRKIERRYSMEEVENNENLRDAVARIEIDTVRFGFGEGFLREEEIDNLDRIAEIMEKIIAANPNEVFMIEGHTDAVGSDAANLQLSRQRAMAVKEALSTYYVIPPENLETVGFGERYLKIPTAEAEQENRRVSVARITPLVGALAD
jgi:outer membrane protein OmpA-like peptidoglycan-associated protein